MVNENPCWRQENRSDTVKNQMSNMEENRIFLNSGGKKERDKRHGR